MRRLVALLALSLSLFAVGGYCVSQAQWSPQVRAVVLAKKPVSSAVGYVGPGDLATFSAWWGLRCYSAAYAGNVARVKSPSDALSTQITCAPGGVLGSTGTAIATTCATGCTVDLLTDQTGNGNDVSQATENLRPKYIQAGSATCTTTLLHCLFFDTSGGSLVIRLRGTITTVNQSFSLSTVAKRTAFSTFFGPVITGNSFGIYFNSVANQAIDYAGSVSATAAATESVFHALNATFNGASSALMVDGSDTTGLNPGAGNFASVTSFGDSGTASSSFNGNATEGGVYSGGSNAIRAQLDSNQRLYWGIP